MLLFHECMHPIHLLESTTLKITINSVKLWLLLLVRAVRCSLSLYIFHLLSIVMARPCNLKRIIIEKTTTRNNPGLFEEIVETKALIATTTSARTKLHQITRPLTVAYPSDLI